MGSRILANRYELIERIGEGGMAVVFKARDRLLNRMVAIKILRPEYTRDSLFVESFRRESQIAANLVHPNIVNIYDVGKQGNIYYIVMELIDGKPLSTIIREQGPLDPRWAADIAKEVASALSLAHKNQLIHRDVKPHNIMITKEGIAKITDFGIAKAVSRDTFVGEQKDAIMGSVHYFSPEQARGAYVDERSDIYSLGIVLYEMLTGRVPFDGETAVEVAVKHMNEQMVPPSRIKPDIPKDLEDIIMKATSKLQTGRYKNADEMITALNFVKFSRHSESSGVSKADIAGEAAEQDHGDKQDDGSQATRNIQTGEDKKEKTEEKKPKKPHKPAKPIEEDEDLDEDEDDEEIVPFYKARWFHVLLALCVGLMLAVPVGRFISNKYNSMENKPSIDDVKELIPGMQEQVEAPNLRGKDVDEARRALAQQGLNLEVEMELVSREYPAGQIMSQKPTPGTMIKSGQSIRVSVSKGEAVSLVPDLLEKTYAGAKLIIESYGFEVGEVTYSYSEDFRENAVMGQSPVKGTELGEGGKIDLVISQGKEPDEAPTDLTVNVIGLEFEKAKEKIESLGLAVGSVMRTSNVSVPEGCVISQEPGTTTALEPGAEIDLVVSTGAEKNEAPAENTQTGQEEPSQETKSVSIPVDFTKAEEDIFLLTVNVSDDVNGSRTPISRQQTEKAEGSRIITVTGTGTNGRVVIRFGNTIAYDLKVNFETGEFN
ncbi:MAG: Stk1 family PASTA domain-containing Ser/Thr kinase [Firmicutes bacterium]|nr:Stk1 family PASTA domain-containing Ser/Thr kinase [Bacillota bacterium]